MKNTESHGIAFKRAVEASPLSKSELGRQVGVTPQSVYHWETRGVPARFAFRVAALLGVDADDISAIEKAPDGVIGDNERLAIVSIYAENGERSGDHFVDLTRLKPGGKSVNALEISTAAMVPEICVGDMVFFSPDSFPNPGEFCVARDPSGSLMVRLYRQVDNAGAFSLVATSRDWPDITTSTDVGDYEIVGSVLYAITYSKLPSEYVPR